MKRLQLFLAVIYCLFCFQLSSLEEDWNRVYLATYPRSGNHWARFVIEEATNLVTGSVYCDQTAEHHHLLTPLPWGGYACDHGYEGNREYPQKEDIVVVKTHFPALPKMPFDSAPSLHTIRIVRHPVDSFYSFYIFVCTAYNMKPAPKVPAEFVKGCISSWRIFQEYWSKQPNTTTFIYEDLLKDPYQGFSEMLTAIGYAVEPEDVLRAIEKNPPRDHVLKHLGKFTPADLKLIASELKDLMQPYGYTIPL